MYNISYANKSKTIIEKYEQKQWINKLHPQYKVVEKGVVLPRKLNKVDSNKAPYQGMGGVVDKEDNFIKESVIYDLVSDKTKYAFGGYYNYKIQKEDENVAIYLGLANMHWGHFLIDNIQRIWFLLENKDYINTLKHYKIVFCGTEDNRTKFVGNYEQFFELLGLDVEKIEIVNIPTRFSKVIVPDISIYPGEWITDSYKNIFDQVIKNALKSVKEDMIIYKKIYFSRLHLRDNKEIGEEYIEVLMRKCGYSILYPEELTLIEQIYYWQTAEEIACVNGTIPHNCVFAHSGLKLYVFTKMSRMVGYQFTMDAVHNIETVYIDAYREPFNRYPLSVSRGPFWIYVTEDVKKFVEEKYGFRVDTRHYKGGNFKYLKLCCFVEFKYHLRGARLYLKKISNCLKKK